jgi:hypothetical protein
MATVAKRAVFREVPTLRIDGRNLVVGIHPHGVISVRLKGTRQVQTITAAHAWDTGKRMKDREERARRKSARDKRRLEKELALAFEKPHFADYPSRIPAKATRKRLKRRATTRRTKRRT